MYQFRTCIHPLATDATPSATVDLQGSGVESLRIESPPFAFAVTFDRASEILATLPRMFIEPDGSFVWAGELDGKSWQVDGVLYDEGPSLSYVELSGTCPPNDFDQFLAALGWPAAPVMFQLVEEGVFLGEAEFRQVAVGR